MQELRTKMILIYSTSTSANHSESMKLLSELRIYLSRSQNYFVGSIGGKFYNLTNSILAKTVSHTKSPLPMKRLLFRNNRSIRFSTNVFWGGGGGGGGEGQKKDADEQPLYYKRPIILKAISYT